MKRLDNNSIIQRSGGFYTNLLDLVFRIALSQINQYIKQDFLIIDEIMDAVAEDNRHKIPMIFDYLKQYYSYVIMITHDKYLKEFIECNMEITKDNQNKSHITFFNKINNMNNKPIVNEIKEIKDKKIKVSKPEKTIKSVSKKKNNI